MTDETLREAWRIRDQKNLCQYFLDNLDETVGEVRTIFSGITDFCGIEHELDHLRDRIKLRLTKRLEELNTEFELL